MESVMHYLILWLKHPVGIEFNEGKRISIHNNGIVWDCQPRRLALRSPAPHARRYKAKTIMCK
jgi:hypothetical protein